MTAVTWSISVESQSRIIITFSPSSSFCHAIQLFSREILQCCCDMLTCMMLLNVCVQSWMGWAQKSTGRCTGPNWTQPSISCSLRVLWSTSPSHMNRYTGACRAMCVNVCVRVRMCVCVCVISKSDVCRCFFSHVYKCVCQQHSELLYNDLMWKITCHLERVSSELQVSKFN